MGLDLYYSREQYLSKDAKVVVTYLRNPFFAGDDVSVLVTFGERGEKIEKSQNVYGRKGIYEERNSIDEGTLKAVIAGVEKSSGESDEIIIDKKNINNEESTNDKNNIINDEKDIKNKETIDDTKNISNKETISDKNSTNNKKEKSNDKEVKAIDDYNEQSWSRRISSQFSRSLFKEEYETSTPMPPPEPTEETYFSGSAQLFGYFTADDELFDLAKFDQLRQNSVISGCIAGVPSLKVSGLQKSFFQNFTNNLSSLLSISDESRDVKPFLNIQPVFVTNQVLMFPALLLKKGSFKQYYIRFKLPETLPPSYNSSTFSITYQLIINAERLRHANASPTSINLTFPLKIAMAPRPNGLQPVSQLHQEFMTCKRALLRTKHFVYELSARKKPFEDFSFLEKMEPQTRSVEPIPEEVEPDTDFLKEEFLNTVQTLISKKGLTTTEQIKSLPSTPLIHRTFAESHHGDSANNTLYETKNGYTNPFSDNNVPGNERIKQFTACALNGQLHTDKMTTNAGTYEPIMKESLKTQFLVKYRNKFVSKLTFDKPFYKIGENISLTFDFTDSDKTEMNNNFKVSGVSVSLQSFEKPNYEYLVDYANVPADIKDQFAKNPVQAQKDWKFARINNTLQQLSLEEINENEYIEREIINKNPNYWKKFTRTHWTKKYSLLANNYKKLNISDLFLQYNLAPQFSTNVVRITYSLLFKFVLIDESKNQSKAARKDTTAWENIYLQQIHSDANGKLYSAKDSLVGLEFTVKIPFNIIASEYDFNNINV